ncbi:MAG: hypothetical protein QNJ37_21030 [Crocosphaera sp.]|nr:hypothetical protein [Crocosphaera sp.]
MFLLGVSALEIQQLLEDPNVKNAINEVIKNSPPDGITANQFFILSIALALSTYLSTVSREVTSSIKKDIYKRRANDLREKQDFLNGLMFGDILIWIFLLFPIGLKVTIWFIQLDFSTDPYKLLNISKFTFAIGFFVILSGTLYLHIEQWRKQLPWRTAIVPQNNIFLSNPSISAYLQELSSDIQNALNEIHNAQNPADRDRANDFYQLLMDELQILRHIGGLNMNQQNGISITDQDLRRATQLPQDRYNNAIDYIQNRRGAFINRNTGNNFYPA